MEVFEELYALADLAASSGLEDTPISGEGEWVFTRCV